METTKKLGFKEKFAYGLGAVGKDMVYMLSASYVLYYYQDIMGVSAWVMGIILLVARVFDAFNDPLMGVIVAKTKSRWGKFRPWLFLGTLTNAIVLFVMFAAPPSLTAKGLVAYAAIFYILWGVTYTMMDIPYWSMVPAFTKSGKEREGMAALGRTCAGVGSAIVTIITMIAVTFIGSTLTGKSKNNVNVKLNSPEVYVMELNEASAATGEYKLLSNASIDVTGDKSEFAATTYFTQDNSKYTINLDGTEYTKDNSKLQLAIDSEDSSMLILYLDEAEYASVNEDSQFTASLTSTKEVERVGFKYFSLIIAVLFFLFILVTCICIKEKSTVDVETVGVGQMFKSLIKNDQAMAMVITIVMVNTATYITSNLLIYFFKYDLAGSNWQGNYTLFNTFAGGIQILAMMAFFPLLRKFFNTMKIFTICIISAIAGYVILLVMALTGTSAVYPFLVPGFFIMAAVGIMNVLVTIFLANTVDYGDLKNNRREESVIFSMQTFVVKLASGIAALIASICLSVFKISEGSGPSIDMSQSSLVVQLKDYMNGIIENGALVVSNNSVVGLRLVMTLLPVLVLILAFIVFKKRYTLTDARLADISEQLAARKGQASSAAE